MDTLQNPGVYLQKRVALFARVELLLFLAGLTFDVAVPAENEPLVTGTRVGLFALVVVHLGVWLYLRKEERPALLVRVADVLLMLMATAAFALQPVYASIPGVSSVLALWGPVPMAIATMLRAAVIPSPVWLSVALSLVWGVAMTWSAVYAWDASSFEMMGRESQDLPLQFNLAATFGFTIVAGVVTRVVHGLRTKAREAMQLGQYTLDTKIGEGGMGVVYRAHHAMLRRPTAVKLLPVEKSSADAIVRFEAEVQQTSRLTHPNTVAIFDYGRTEDGVFYYAMEYLDGISLEDLVERYGPLPEERVIHLTIQAAEALAEAHAMNLVHRDVKPDNMMVCQRGGIPDVVKVLDFGLVKEVDASGADAKTTQTIQGTPLYMAPEALLTPEKIDARTDLYALGAVAYFLLTACPVFDGNVNQVLAHHLQTQPVPPGARVGKKLDAILESAVLRMLDKDPDARFANAGEFVEALRASPCASGWTREKAGAWWAEHKGAIEASRDQKGEPVHNTLGLADTESVIRTFAPGERA